MPTIDEFNELLEHCSSEWTTLNEVEGIKFTGKNIGNSIFLPAKGYLHLYDNFNIGAYGYYWPASLHAGGPRNAYDMVFHADEVYTRSFSRYYGQSIRPSQINHPVSK